MHAETVDGTPRKRYLRLLVERQVVAGLTDARNRARAADLTSEIERLEDEIGLSSVRRLYAEMHRRQLSRRRDKLEARHA